MLLHAVSGQLFPCASQRHVFFLHLLCPWSNGCDLKKKIRSFVWAASTALAWFVKAGVEREGKQWIIGFQIPFLLLASWIPVHLFMFFASCNLTSSLLSICLLTLWNNWLRCWRQIRPIFIFQEWTEVKPDPTQSTMVALPSRPPWIGQILHLGLVAIQQAQRQSEEWSNSWQNSVAPTGRS